MCNQVNNSAMITTKLAINKMFSFLCWPVLFTGTIGFTQLGFEQGHPLIYFNIAYFSLAFILALLEIAVPFERNWHVADGQTFANIAHTLSSKGTVQGLALFSSAIGITHFITPLADQDNTLWPRHLPMLLQVIMVCIIAEFMLYWAHRLSHRFDYLWRFHSIHHSVTKLWIVNTGRFHLVDSLFKIVGVVIVLVLLGVPMEVVQWLSIITAYIGLMTHCNVNMKNGYLSYIFNTPEVHRWHHSRNIAEGNKNYGENIVVWDLVFYTYYAPRDKRPPADIGIDDTMPASFTGQLLYPFRRNYYRRLHAENKLATYP